MEYLPKATIFLRMDDLVEGVRAVPSANGLGISSVMAFHAKEAFQGFGPEAWESASGIEYTLHSQTLSRTSELEIAFKAFEDAMATRSTVTNDFVTIQFPKPVSRCSARSSTG